MVLILIITNIIITIIALLIDGLHQKMSESNEKELQHFPEATLFVLSEQSNMSDQRNIGWKQWGDYEVS